MSTFRSRVAAATDRRSRARPDANNFFGTMEEDAERRDFTINALYYCPIDQQLIDYVGAYPDLRHRRLKTLGRAESSFAEDPVRMIRAVKYASLLGFPFPSSLAGLVRRMRESILSCSRERVTEEVYKILTSGAAAEILELAQPAAAVRGHLSRPRAAAAGYARTPCRLSAGHAPEGAGRGRRRGHRPGPGRHVRIPVLGSCPGTERPSGRP